MDISVYNKLYTSITGIKLSQNQMFKTGRRIHILERYMNTREGITRKDDTLPKRFLEEPRLSDSKKWVVPLDKMLAKYYKKKGYDNNGIPLPKTLAKLGIEV